MRVALVAATFAFAVVLYLLMLKGWRSRQRRQGDLPAPAQLPADGGPVLVGATHGLFVGTTVSPNWLDRVAVHSLSDRSAGVLTVRGAGIVIDRDGLAELFMPWDSVLGAAPGDALAGKVVGPDGLLILTWRLGARTLLSGFRADDHAAHQHIADAINARITDRKVP